jgi:hypothetical protein
MGGRAPWPTVRLSCGKERCGAAQRGHARDGFSRSTTWGLHEEFIRLRPGAHRRNGELRPTAPTNLEILHFFDFFRKAGKENYAEFSSDFYIQTRFFSRASGSCLACAKRKHCYVSRTGFFPEAGKTAFACAQAKADLPAQNKGEPIYTPFGPAPLR